MKRLGPPSSDIPSLRASLLSEWPERRLLYDRTPHWITHSEFSELRELLGAALSGLWKILQPVKAFRLHKIRSWASEGNRRKLNDMFLERRCLDPELAGLNVEQRKAVMTQEDRTLIIAGAGTGKTHTMVAKAHDTVRTGISKPAEMAFVTFTNAAAEEIRERCSTLDGIAIGTIHELARQIIRVAERKRPRLSPLAHEEHKRDRLDHIERWLVEAIQEDPSLLVDLCARRAAAERCASPAAVVPPYVAVPPDRRRVKSWGEAQIAMTLHLAGVAYLYEAEFPVPARFQSSDGRRYHPDFFLPDDPDSPDASVDGGIWYEHFAHDTQRQLPAGWSEEDRERYEEDRGWKEHMHRQLGTRFAVTGYGDIERCRATGASFPALVLQRIAALGRSSAALPTPSEVQDHIDELKAQDQDARHLPVTHEIDAWIRTYRQQLPGRSIPNRRTSDRDLLDEAGALKRLALPVMQRYEAHLASTGDVDHEGTILNALRYVEDGRVQSPWHVLLVDEYQDVNPAQAAFVHALGRSAAQASAPRRPRMTAVGDDWQAIFGFQGGDVELIRGFEDPASSSAPFCERVTLKQTYRFGPELASSTQHFATRDKSAIKRQFVGLPGRRLDRKWPICIVLAAAELTEQGRRLFGWAGDHRTCAVVAALSRIAEQSKHQAAEPSVLILGRKNTDIGGTETQPVPGLDRNQIRRACEQSGILVEFSTVHKAKGREADYVIFIDTGPPRAAESGRNKAKERALSLLRYGGPNAGEERRIWYVALTRARQKAYVISDTSVSPLSPLFDELMRNEDGAYDVSGHELADYLESTAPLVPCPKCAENGENTAVLTLRSGPNGPFASCTSYVAGDEHYCGHTERACETCGSGLMARNGDGRASCSNPGCGHVVPLCRCSPPRPMTLRRNKKTREPFWGCQSYGTEGSCKKTRPLSDPTGIGSRGARRSVRASIARR